MNQQRQYTLGSLFDGIGGFPYAGKFFGIEPLWASEIMPCAVSVTRRNLPDMAHVGDITKLHGGELPPVDIITFGSPCQGLSHAGKRLGLADERSGLFSEAIRIIKEMRDATNGQYPRYALWENVPGALSSGQPAGSDFKAVLEAFTEAEVPFPRSGKWANAGMVRSDRADIAWCVYNAQYFGTAQRRRRIFLVADFAGTSAGEILFVPKSLSGYFAAGGIPRQGAATYASCGADGAVEVLNDQGGDSLNVEKGNHSPTLRSQTHGNLPVVATEQTVYGICSYSSNSMKSPNPASGIYEADTSRTLDTTGGSPACNQGGMAVVCLTPWDTQQARVVTEEGISPTLAGADGGGGRSPAGLLFTAGFIGSAGAKAQGIGFEEECAPTLKGGGGLTVLCATEEPCGALGVHQNQSGDVNISDTAYTLATSSNASARNAPLVAHPTISGTLCASGAGLSRPAGMASETDLCVAYCLQGNMVGRQDQNGPRGDGVNTEIAYTLTGTDVHSVAKAFTMQRSDEYKEDGLASTQAARQYKSPTDLVCSAVDCRNYKEIGDHSGTLQAKDKPGYSLNFQNPVRTGYIVRRLTPTECERLQGYPDGWTEFDENGKPISDSRRYQMLGNSVAVPCVAYILQGMAQQFALPFRKEAA